MSGELDINKAHALEPTGPLAINELSATTRSQLLAQIRVAMKYGDYFLGALEELMLRQRPDKRINDMPGLTRQMAAYVTDPLVCFRPTDSPKTSGGYPRPTASQAFDEITGVQVELLHSKHKIKGIVVATIVEQPPDEPIELKPDRDGPSLVTLTSRALLAHFRRHSQLESNLGQLTEVTKESSNATLAALTRLWLLGWVSVSPIGKPNDQATYSGLEPPGGNYPTFSDVYSVPPSIKLTAPPLTVTKNKPRPRAKLSPLQVNTLRLVNEKGPQSLIELAQLLGERPSMMSEPLDDLLRRGLLRRIEADGRYLYELTLEAQ